jgi:WD40 repeat protein
VIHLLSIPEGELLRSIELESFSSADWLMGTDDSKLMTVTESEGRLLAQSWPLPEGEPVELGRFEQTTHSHGSRWLVDHSGKSIYGRPVDALQDPARLLGWHEQTIVAAAFSRDGRWMASGDSAGEVRLWSLAAAPESPLRTLSGDGGSGIRDLAFDPAGRRLAVAVTAGAVQVWDLEGPLAADPLLLTAREMQVNTLTFSQDGAWLATAGEGLRLWPLTRPYAQVLSGHEAMTLGVDFSGDGSWVASSSADGTVRQWPLTPEAGAASRVLYKHPLNHLAMGLAVEPGGRFVLAGISGSGGTWLLPVGDDEARELPEGFERQAWHVGLSPDGRFAAAADGLFNPEEGVIRVWDLEKGTMRVLDRGEGDRGNTTHLDFTADNRLISGGHRSVRSWNVEDGTYEDLRIAEGDGEAAVVASGLSATGRFLASFVHGDDHLLLHDLESGEVRQVYSHVEAYGGHSDWKEIIVDSAGEMVVTASSGSGELRAGPVTGEDAHLLLGHEGGVWQIAFSPDDRWIASVGRDSTVRLWPRPQGKAFHTLPYEELLDRLRALTNLRAVRDDDAPGGYRLETGPFPGWGTVPSW